GEGSWGQKRVPPAPAAEEPCKHEPQNHNILLNRTAALSSALGSSQQLKPTTPHSHTLSYSPHTHTFILPTHTHMHPHTPTHTHTNVRTHTLTRTHTHSHSHQES